MLLQLYSGDRTDSRYVPLCKTEEMIGYSIVTTIVCQVIPWVVIFFNFTVPKQSSAQYSKSVCGVRWETNLHFTDRSDKSYVPLCKTEEMIGCSIVTTPLGEPRSRRHFLSGNCMIVASTDQHDFDCGVPILDMYTKLWGVIYTSRIWLSVTKPSFQCC